MWLQYRPGSWHIHVAVLHGIRMYVWELGLLGMLIRLVTGGLSLEGLSLHGTGLMDVIVQVSRKSGPRQGPSSKARESPGHMTRQC
jgi:hypothetical protein